MTPTVFVSDASVEAERIGQVLRAAGYIVADVPLSMLHSRVAVQRPDVVLLDADAPSALEQVAKVRELPDAGAIDFLFVGGGQGPIRDADDALAHEGSAYFQRPVDVAGLVRKVEALTGGPAVQVPGAGRRISTPPPSIPAARASGPSLSSASPSSGLRAPGPPLPLSVSQVSESDSLPKSLASLGTMSAELQRLLSDAELRVEAQRESSDGAIASPDEEIEAVLPAEILAALDEPLEAAHDEPDAPGQDTGIGAHAKGTTTGASRQQTTGAGNRGSTPGTFERLPQRTAATSNMASGARRLTGVSEAPAFPSDLPRGPSQPSYTPTPMSVYPASDSSPAAPPVAQVPPPDLRALTGGEPGVLPPSRKASAVPPTSLGVASARSVFADAITRRVTGAVCFEADEGVRRIVLREGDVVTAASGVPGESLVHYLVARGEMLRAEADKLAGKVPPFGRHAGAALVAHGSLAQDQLWETLRGHAEWILCAIARESALVTATYEPEPPGRLRVEPSVFGAVTGCELFIDVVRRSVSADEAGAALGGPDARVGDGPHAGLLGECGLAPHDLEIAARARGGTVQDLLARTGDTDALVLVYALSLLGVVEASRPPASDRAMEVEVDPAIRALDEEATRARILARLEVVEDGDYFAILGVSRDATSYEIRRAFLELRRTFEPSAILTPRLAKHAGDVRKIVLVLEEAYDILRDPARRERYRRAIEASPA